jgi:hypothetical protein
VLDNVERRRFLVKPAGKDPCPALVGLLDVDLDEGPGQFLLFPRRSRLARAQAHDHVLPADRLAGMERNVLDDAVALVEDAERGHPLPHRGHARLIAADRRRGVADHRFGRIFVAALAAGGERERHQDERSSERAHVYSGIQGS